MSKFQTFAEATLEEMYKMPKNADEFLAQIYWDSSCNDNCIVMFMEYGAYNHIHAVMKEFHTILSNKMGHPVSICHNHPTDEIVLIHSDPTMASVYYSDACCKQETIECCLRFLETRTGYLPQIQSIALAAECLANGLNKTPEYILDMLDWNKDPQAQLIQHLINFHM